MFILSEKERRKDQEKAVTPKVDSIKKEVHASAGEIYLSLPNPDPRPKKRRKKIGHLHYSFGIGSYSESLGEEYSDEGLGVT